MSTRRAARTLDERLASVEEFIRRLQGDSAVTPTDVRYLYGARGDILFATGPSDPDVIPIGDIGDVLTVNADGDPEWEDPDRVRPSLINVAGSLFVGTGSGRYVVLAPGPDGSVLTADSTAGPSGLRWV